NESLCIIPEDKRIKLALYKNSIVHWLQDESLAFLSHECFAKLEMEPAKLFGWLRELLRSELIFSPRPSESATEVAQSHKLALEKLERVDAFNDPRTKELLSSGVLPFIEGYYVALKAVIGMTSRAFSELEFVRIALRKGENLYHLGEAKRPEVINRILFNTALIAFSRLGLLRDKVVVMGEGRAEKIYEKHNLELINEALSRLETILKSCE
ncbi:MAG: hypothetical protein QXH91_07610, partial [Candidatus Bathyarchaeia archaeon]